MEEKSPDKEKKGGRANPQGDFPIQEYRLVPIDSYTDQGADGDIDLLELAKTIWDNRTTIYRFVAVGLVLGLIVAFGSDKEYEAYTTLMPEYENTSQSGAAGLLAKYGGLIGVSSSGTYAANSNAIRVDLYPQIIQSLPLQRKLLKERIHFSEYDTTVTVYQYFNEVKKPPFLGYLLKYTIDLPFTILSVLKPGKVDTSVIGVATTLSVVRLTKAEDGIIKNLQERIIAELDIETGIVTVKSKMPEPLAAAVLADIAVKELTSYLIDYRTQKLKVDQAYLKLQLDSAKVRFEKAQLGLLRFREANRGSLSPVAQNELEQLNLEFQIASSFYKNFAEQLEKVKLKIQEETPFFSVLEPVVIPLVKSEPNRVLIMFVMAFLSGAGGVLWIIVNNFFRKKTE